MVLMAVLSYLTLMVWLLVVLRPRLSVIQEKVTREMHKRPPARTRFQNCSKPFTFLDDEELDGVVLTAGHGEDPFEESASKEKEAGLHTMTAQECCEACRSTRGCNIFVWGSEKLGKTLHRQCWLKRTDKEEEIQERTATHWTSGILDKDWIINASLLPPAPSTMSRVVLRTIHGSIRIRLKDQWSQRSVDYIRLLAHSGLCYDCGFYRSEKGFLLQGVLRGLIPVVEEAKKVKTFDTGDVGWAGPWGPHFFIYMGRKDQSLHWGEGHVWGYVEGNQSMSVVNKILSQPATHTVTRTGEMNKHNNRVTINLEQDAQTVAIGGVVIDAE